MISGALNFTLGLQVNDFANKLGFAGGKLLAFTALTSALSAAMNKMWTAVQQGGKFTDLAAAASVSVKDLYQLRRGFEEVGASADSVGSVLQRLRSNLAGGQQDSLIQKLGLDPKSLRAANPAEQFTRITDALAKLDATSRAGVAQKLFGREGAQVASMIANSGTSFADAMQRAAKDATVWDRVSNTFDAIADKAVEIQRHIETLWAGLAGTLIAAWKAGKMEELIGLSFAAGMEKAVTIWSAAMDAMAQIFVATLGNGNLWKGMTEMWIGTAVNLGTRLSEELFGPIADLMGDREGFDQRQQERRDYAARQARDAAASLTAGTREATPAIMAAFKTAWDSALTQGDAEKKLRNFVDGLLAGLAGTKAGSSGVTEAIEFGKASKFEKPNVTDIERMGFVFNRGGLGGTDYNRDTAANTRTIVELQRKANNLLEKISTTNPGNFANIA